MVKRSETTGKHPAFTQSPNGATQKTVTPLRNAQNITIAVFTDAHSHQNCHIPDFTTPGPF